MNIANLLRRSGQVHADRPAVWHGDELRFDYQTLAHRTAALAGFLRQAFKVLPGERIAIFATNVPEYLEALQAIYWAGAVSVPVNAKLHHRELAHVLADAEPCLWLVTPDLLQTAIDAGANESQLLVLGSPAYREALFAAPAELTPRQPDDLASLFYTSGTTGRPKGVMQTHRNLLAMTACYFMDVDDVHADDAMLYAAPLSHGAGLYHFAHMARGARHVVPRSGGFDAEEIMALAQSVGRLSFFAAPTMVRRLVQHVRSVGADTRGIKTIVYGGGPMYLEDIKTALDVLGPRLVQIYGQGESPMTITALSRDTLEQRGDPDWLRRAASVGVAQTAVEVAVVDTAGRTLGPSQLGEVVVRGATVMAGYWRNPEATAGTLKDGWLYTGDMGILDEDGFLTLKDRSKDLIISGGSNIYPREVEEVLLMHPAVNEATVVGMHDPEWGEVPVAFLALHAETRTDTAELDAWCLRHLARFKRPKHYRVVDSLPKNSYGKVLKTLLREQLEFDVIAAHLPSAD
ncbi:MAG: AMP-binding protein [Pigmentiphaga sp.]|nr:AMP-binding protein [Pigmentiphaga sp.]